MNDIEMTTAEIAAGFATALSKEWGPAALVDLIEHATDAPPREPLVFRVADVLDRDNADALDPTHMVHHCGGLLCATMRIRGSCSRCNCGAVIWDDR